MKRIFIFIGIILSISIYTAYAEVEYNEEQTAVEFLQTLGIFDDAVPDTYSDKVTREDFAYYIAKMNGLKGTSQYRYFRDVQKDSYAFAYISDLTEKGILSVPETEIFRPFDYITYNECIKMIVASLGYDKYAQLCGGYPKGYLDVADDLDIYSVNTKNITFSEAARMIYDALQCNTYEINGFVGQKMEFSQGNTTLLEDIFDISIGKGIVTDTSYGSISNDEPLDEPYIQISNKKYTVSDDFDTKDFLGMYTKYFYSKDDEKVLYMCCNNKRKPDKHINIKDYDEYLGDSVTYFDGDNLKKIKLSNQPILVYNGLPLRTKVAYTMQNLNKGEIVLRDSDDDSVYDLVLVTDYKNFFVATIEPNSKIIYNELEPKNSIDIGNADRAIVFKGQNQVDFKKIEVGMSLSVAETQNKKIIQIIINTDNIVGRLKGFNEETIKIDSVEYSVDKSYITEFKGKFSVGIDLNYIIDTFGNIVYVSNNESVWTLGYIIKSYIDDEDSDVVKIKLFSENNKPLKISLAKKVTIDGQKYNSSEDVDLVLKSIIESNRLIQYKLNEKEEIVILDSLIYNNNEDSKHSLTKVFNEVKSRFYMSDGVERYGHTAYLTSDTVIFYIPQDIYDSDEYYARKGTLNSIGNVMVTLDAYYCGEDRSYVNAVVCQRDYTEYDVFSLMMIDKVTMTLNEDNENVYMVEGYVNGAMRSVEIDEKFSGVNDCNRGDMIVIKRDKSTNTKIVDILKMYDAQTGEISNFALSEPMYIFNSGVNANIGDYCEKYNIAFGSVQRVFSSGLVSIGKTPGGKESDRVIFQGKTCIIYDTETNSISKGTFNDMLDYRTAGYDCSKVMYNTHWDDVQGAFVFK